MVVVYLDVSFGLLWRFSFLYKEMKMFLIYFSLCIIYVVFSLGNWIAPPVVDAIGPKITMLIGAVMYW